MKLNLKKTTAFLAAVSMIASTMLYYPHNTFSALAENTQETKISLDSELFSELPTNDELFAGYVDKAFYGGGGISTFSIGNRTAGSQLTGDGALVYNALAKVIKEIASGERTSTIVKIGKGAGDVEPDGSFSGSLDDLFNGPIQEVVNALLLDFPYEMYWADKTVGMQAGGSDNWRTGKISYVALYIPVSKDYALDYDNSANAGNYTTDKKLTSATSKAVATANSIVEANRGRLDFRKLTAYKDAICELTSYNYDVVETKPAYGDPWQMIYVFDDDPSTTVVCEGYAKAFQYLCDKTEFYGDISCYCITGALNGGHMWNIVTMEDGKNYLVDVTNSDADTVGASGGLFLAGGSGSPASGYTFNTSNGRLTYAYDSNNPWGTDVLTLSSTGYSWNTVAGDVVITEDTYIPSGQTLTFTEGSTLTVAEGVSFKVNGNLNFLGTGQQLFGDFTGTGTLYVKGVEHIHDMSGNAVYTQIDGDDENHQRVGSCKACPIGLVDSENGVIEPHTFNENGFCTGCDGYEPAQQDTQGTFGIENAGQLYWFANKVNGSYDTYGAANAQLLADITINESVLNINGLAEGNFRNWTPIGKNGAAYAGTFNGNSHTISGLFAKKKASAMGLFGHTASTSVISSLGIADSYIEGGSGTESGGIAGRNYGEIRNCSVDAIVGGESDNAGGISGRVYGTVRNSYFVGSVSGAGDCGAICGRNYGRLQDCYYDSTMFTGKSIGFSSTDITPVNVSGLTSDVFASGEAAYLLSQNLTESIWSQKLGTDAYPRFGTDSPVHRFEQLNCGGDSKNPPEYIYTNDETLTLVPEQHSFDADGICEVCGDYEPAVDADADSYYDIRTIGNLYWAAQQTKLDDNFFMELMQDLTLPAPAEGESNWEPIGSKTEPFTGYIEGNGYTISGLTLTAIERDAGFIGYMGNNGNVKNLNFTNAKIICEDANCVGVVAGTSYHGLIENCFVDDTCTVSGNQCAGGIVGITHGMVVSCTNAASVEGKNDVGGIAGSAVDAASVGGCRNLGIVKGESYVGGLLGSVFDSTVFGCYHAGFVQYNGEFGGTIVGGASDASIDGCYYRNDGTADEGYLAPELSIGSETENTGMVDGEALTWPATAIGMNRELEKHFPDVFWGMDVEQDILPTIGGPTVYCGYTSCGDDTLRYSNSPLSEVRIHDYTDEGFCSVCDAYEPAVLNLMGEYEISNAGMLYWFADYCNSENLNADAILTQDIAISQDVRIRNWISIGTPEKPYTGSFNGQFYSITGLMQTDTEAYFAGFVGCNEGTIENLRIEIILYPCEGIMGGICTENAGTIRNCYVMGDFDDAAAGGICYRNNGEIEACFAEAYSENAASLAFVNDGSITNCCYLAPSEEQAAITENNSAEVRIYGFTQDDLALGGAAWILQGEQDEKIWGQTIGMDTFPVLGGEPVYSVHIYGCPMDTEPETGYSNRKNEDSTADSHPFRLGACTECGLPCTHEMHDGSCVICGTTEGILKNMDFSTEYVYGDEIIVSEIFFITNSDLSQLTYLWKDAYGRTLAEAPTEPGSYQLHLTIPEVAYEDSAYTQAELVLSVTIDRASPNITAVVEEREYIEGEDLPEISFLPEGVDGVIGWISQIRQLLAGENTLTWEFIPTQEEYYDTETGTVVIYAETTTTTTTTTTEPTTTTTEPTTTTTEPTTTTTEPTTTTTEPTTTTTEPTTTTTEPTTTTTEPTTTTTEPTTTTTEPTTTTTEPTTTTTETTTTTTEPTTTTTEPTTTTTEPTTTTTEPTTTTTEPTTTTTEPTTTTTESTTTTTTTTTNPTTTTTTTTSESTTTTTTTTTESTATTTTTTTKPTTTTTTTTTESTTTTTTTTTESTTTIESTTKESTTTTTTTTSESTTTTTTTTTESTTTTTTIESTTTTTTSESTTTTSVVGYTYSVETKAPQFYFSDDASAFDAADLIERMIRFAVYSDGSVSEEGEEVTDMDCLDLGDITPETLYNEKDHSYTITMRINDAFGTQELETTVPVFIGVKGDANMDGMTDAKDAAEILVYAAAVGAGTSQPLYSEDDATLEAFVFMLADVNGNQSTKSSLDATDAAAILVYAAAAGSGEEASWDEILGAAS